MVFCDVNSWKKKIDPAFDKPIKTYIKHLDNIQELPNGWQATFQDEFLELTEEVPDLLADYDNESGTDMHQFVEKIGLIAVQEDKIFLDTLSAIDKYDKSLRGLQKGGSRINILRFFKMLYLRFSIQPKITPYMHSLLKLAEGLTEEESKQYYLRKINIFIKDISTKHFINFKKDFVLMFFSLFMRISLNRIDGIIEENVEDEKIEHLKSNVVNQILGNINSTMSQLANQKDMSELLANMEKGDDKSLIKAVTIDKSLRSNKYVDKRIGQAQVNGDKEFMNMMGNAIKKGQLDSVARHGKTYAVISFFWCTELSKLSYQELSFFLKSCGLEVHKHPDAFNQFIYRKIKLKKIK